MKSIIRLATKDDEPFLWEMLYYAAHMDEDGEVSPQAAKENPDLLKYVNDWAVRRILAVLPLNQTAISQ